ncbi:MAG: hypothetical protein WKG00_11525 [Polyangiaceae bacterium]
MISSRLAALVALAAALCLAGCSSKMDDKECAKLRGEAFDLLNKGQQCNNDQDCRQSDWPGCAKPVSVANWDKMKPMADGYKKGQCDEPKLECKEPPPSYCKQGLCVHREKGTAEGSGETPVDQIEIK